MISSLHAALLLLASAASPDKPAAVTLCFTGLPPEQPLISAVGGKNYRKLTDDLSVLDLEVRFNGTVVASKLSKANDPSCVKAWVRAQPIETVDASFSRTDTNLSAQTRKLNLKLKPDLLYEGGALTVERKPFARVSTPLTGKLALERRPPMAPGVSPTVPDLKQVPAGEYELKYQPLPPPEVPCDVSLSAETTGTITPTHHADVLDEILESYRADFLPGVLAQNKVKCHNGQQVSVKIRVFDGAVLTPLKPEVKVVTKPGSDPVYRLVVNGNARSFQLGEAIQIGFDDSVVLEEVTPNLVIAK